MRRRDVPATGREAPGEAPDAPPTPAPDATGDTAAPPVDAAPEQRAADSADAAAGGLVDVGEGETQPTDVVSLLEAELAEQHDKFLRLAADYENFRRRAARDSAQAAIRGQAQLVSQLLEALDDLARFAHLDPATTDAQTVVEGADLVERKLLKALAAAGLEVVNPAGERFDPERQEAVATAPAGSPTEDNTVSEVYQPGYLFKGQLLRPARVVVRQWSG